MLVEFLKAINAEFVPERGNNGILFDEKTNKLNLIVWVKTKSGMEQVTFGMTEAEMLNPKQVITEIHYILKERGITS